MMLSVMAKLMDERTMVKTRSKFDLPLLCAFCLHRQDGERPEAAITVMGGDAVCYKHMGYALSPNVTQYCIGQAR